MGRDLRVGVAWYRESDWDRLRSLASDRDNLAPTYAQWLATAEHNFAEMIRLGQAARRIDIDVEMLWAWCCANGRQLDGSARAEFVARRTQEVDADSAGE